LADAITKDGEMIGLTRLNGPAFALNCDLIERVEATPDTVITLVDGKRYVVVESVEDVIRRVRVYRASVIALAQTIEAVPPGSELRLVPSQTGD
jgi:flagellar protein FlbD